MLHYQLILYSFVFGSTSIGLVFETFLKCGKLQCESMFNRNEVCLVMTELIEPN